MKKSILLIFFAFLVVQLNAQTVLFTNDFEDGSSDWDLIGDWGTTNEEAYTGSNSFTESPYDATYSNGYVEQVATMNVGVDLSTSLDAEVTFWAQIDLETGFDYMYLDASPDGGSTWFEVAVFNGEGFFTWTEFTYSLGAFVGNTDVRLRFRFEPDFAYEVDGMYIDDLSISGNDVDASVPLILHTPLALYESTLFDNTITASVIDGSGISSTTLYYSVDGGAETAIEGISTGGDEYSYTIPAQLPGSFVDYYFTATDDYSVPNTATSQIWHNIAGEHIFYDNGSTGVDATVYYIGETATEYGAVRITLDDATQLVSIILQTYTDISNPNDSLVVHVWADDGGIPGDDLITPFSVWPESTLDNPYQATRVDLRDYATELSALTGTIFIGYTVEGAYVGGVYTNTGLIEESLTGIASSWFDLFGDFHFRAVTTGGIVPPVSDFSFTGDPIVSFTDLSINTPISWSWNFDDGATSDLQNPSHTYSANGLYDVCLTTTNLGGSNTVCKAVAINNAVLAPVVDFAFSVIGNTATFTDATTNSPTSWSWNFGDGETATEQNPTHAFLASGNYNVCLTASNAGGTNFNCKQVEIIVLNVEENAHLVSLYPNPVATNLSIGLPSLSGNTFIAVYNSIGVLMIQQIITTNSAMLDISAFANGTYILHVVHDAIEIKKLFAVQH